MTILLIEKHRFYTKDMKMEVLESLDQKNDGFLDRERVIDMGRLRCPDTPKTPPKNSFFPRFSRKMHFF